MASVDTPCRTKAEEASLSLFAEEGVRLLNSEGKPSSWVRFECDQGPYYAHDHNKRTTWDIPSCHKVPSVEELADTINVYHYGGNQYHISQQCVTPDRILEIYTLRPEGWEFSSYDL